MRLRCFVCSVLLLNLAAAQRFSAPQTIAPEGPYYALVIGINAYRHENALETPVADAHAIDALLRDRYGFRTKLLIDGQATRAGILEAFGEYQRTLRENDSLLIYYAGHGARFGDEAYWLPVDADPNSRANWIIAKDVTNEIREFRARHVLVISDSCYSGGMSREAGANVLPTDHNAAIAKMLQNRSRVLISSGRDEPVTDGGGSGHSVFAKAVLSGLSDSHEDAFSALNLYDRYVRESVIGRSSQVPLYQMIQNSGHDGGDFVFFPKLAAPPNRLPGPETPSIAPTSAASPARQKNQRRIDPDAARNSAQFTSLNPLANAPPPEPYSGPKIDIDAIAKAPAEPAVTKPRLTGPRLIPNSAAGLQTYVDPEANRTDGASGWTVSASKSQNQYVVTNMATNLRVLLRFAGAPGSDGKLEAIFDERDKRWHRVDPLDPDMPAILKKIQEARDFIKQSSSVTPSH